ncbi:conserved Plasmodium protein, unknown function [Plasmodium ovale wallikeri]|uniref:Uncharacterized protein n=1 Tax=Plasmodium ovale wallikeri TaxID=864142 RepID=A0A1A8Z780_PLAOA|nr:conserved Plasmodium protein, unknown function [Plasmodium ovale wallikeri]
MAHLHESDVKLIIVNSNSHRDAEDALNFFCKRINKTENGTISEELLGELLYIGIVIKKNDKLCNVKENVKGWFERCKNYYISVDIVFVNENNVEVSTLAHKFRLLQENYFENDFKIVCKKMIIRKNHGIGDCNGEMESLQEKVEETNQYEVTSRNRKEIHQSDQVNNQHNFKKENIIEENETDIKQNGEDTILIDLDKDVPPFDEIERMFLLNNSGHIEGMIFLVELPLSISQKYISQKLNLKVQLYENMDLEKKKKNTYSLSEKQTKDLQNIFDYPSLLLNNVHWSSTFTSNVLYKKKKQNNKGNSESAKNNDEYDDHDDDDEDEENNFFLNIYDENNFKDSERNFPLNVNLLNICKSLNNFDEFIHSTNKTSKKNKNYRNSILHKPIIVINPLNIKCKIVDRYVYLEIENITKKNKIEIFELFSRSINIDSGIFPFCLHPEDTYSFFFPIINDVQIISLSNVKGEQTKRSSFERNSSKGSSSGRSSGSGIGNGINNKRQSIDHRNSRKISLQESVNKYKHLHVVEKYKNNREILTFHFNHDKTIISLSLKWCLDNTSNNFIWSQYCMEVEMPTQTLFNLEVSFVKEINYSSILIAIFSFYNNHHEDIDLTIEIQDDNNIINNNMQSSLISFNSIIDVGVIKPYQRKSVNVKLLAIMLGVHDVPFVKVKNNLNDKVYFVDLGSIMVTDSCNFLCLCEIKQNVNDIPAFDHTHEEKAASLKSNIINKIKKKSNEVRMLYNTLNEKNASMPLYIFINDENEQQRQFLKDMFLIGKLDLLQGSNTPFSKYYLSIKNRNMEHKIALDEKLKKEREFVNSLNVQDKKNYIKVKIAEYANLRVNVEQLHSNIEKKFNSVQEIMTLLKKGNEDK